MVGPARSGGVAEALRLRSVHQYAFARDGGNGSPPPTISANKTTSSDTALTAFCQLITWRLNAQRAMVSLVDRDNQYFLAESTSTLNLADTSVADENGVSLWMGCTGSTSREHALCANTIKASQAAGTPYALFWVPDLSKDAAYCRLPYVEGPPHFKFYAGTPLITKDGVPIGSLFAIDERPREEGLSGAEQEFLGVMAQNVMNHLNMQREMEQQKRNTIMSKGLAAFIEGDERIPPSWLSVNDTGVNEVSGSSRRDRSQSVSNGDSPMNDSGHFTNDSTAPACRADMHSDTHAKVLSRASNLLRESLDVDYAVFLDASLTMAADLAFNDNVAPQHDPNASKLSLDDEDPNMEPDSSRRERKEEYHLAAMLSFSTKDIPNSHSHSGDSPIPFKSLEQRLVQNLIRKYPNGVLWTFDEDGDLIQSDGAPLDLGSEGVSDDQPHGFQPDLEDKTQPTESTSLLKSFPGARQILFAPVFDSAASEYICACFAVSLLEVPVFSTEIEVSFVRGFLNSVAAEYDRVSAKLADRQKGDFISSVSHEFRTPLHGILASTSLLLDSKLDKSQKNLCETIDSCGRTLFNTVSHVLDYAKLNSFNRQLNNPSKDVTENGNVSTLHIYSVVDVAKMWEDALRVVYEGYMHDQKVSGVQHTVIDNVSLEIEPGDWDFHCTPGAVQRIIMNVFGNSLKYTKSGAIRCRIERYRRGAAADMAIVRIIVTDTGIGISDDFLRYKLYKPFNQESSLSQGTGLGLSIVEKIVRSLDGSINIKSRLEQGTQVTVELPLLTSQISGKPSSISLLKSKLNGETIALYGFDTKNKRTLKRSLQDHITKWFSMEIVDDLSDAYFIMFDENIPTDTLETIAARPVAPRILLATCDATTATGIGEYTALPIHQVAKPIGPNTLCRALLAILDPFAEPGTQESSVVARQNNLEENAPDSPLKDPAPVQESEVQDNQSPSESLHPTVDRFDLSVKDMQSVLLPTTSSATTEVNSNNNPDSPKIPKILCVDDNGINLKLLRAYLKQLKYTEVQFAVDGLEAYTAVSEATEPFDIIFMDLSMPVCDGFESSRKIRAFETQQPSDQPRANIVAVTGLAADRDQNKAYACGMDYYVTKPLALPHLNELMEQWRQFGRIERQLKT
ncbi:sensor histidine kinase response regulator (hsp90-like protein) [Phlyctema vagabunda]|uniref:Sensor histidine kinase response regulator (Hsp90-like protein) n=1 Tax=Phlyctema vagabunda TaxID=108571 RepID=A0ABR4P7P1_9HELO